MRYLFGLTLMLCVYALRADSPALTITQHLLPSPAPVGATDPILNSTSDGLQLSWIENAAGAEPRRIGTIWNSASSGWSNPAPLVTHLPESSAAPRVIFPDGSELTTTFPERGDRILDLHTQRHRATAGSPPKPLSSESWPQGFTPLEPPLLLAREARVVAAWLNHAEKNPRLFAALSINAGEQFFMPVRIDDGRPLGRASLALLRDGSAYITWLEAHGSANAAALWLRRLSPSGDLSVPVLITTASSADSLGYPQVALLKDYDDTPGQLLVAHELATEGITQLVTRLIELPPAGSFAQGRPCLTCPPDTATLAGHPLTGRLIKLMPEKHQALIEHPEIPGILPAGRTVFRIDEKTRTLLLNATAFLGRVEPRDGLWWLFDVQLLSAPKTH